MRGGAVRITGSLAYNPSDPDISAVAVKVCDQAAKGSPHVPTIGLNFGCVPNCGNSAESIACNNNRSLETAGVASLKSVMRNNTATLAAANLAAGTNVKVGAVMFDCESSEWGTNSSEPNGQPDYIEGVTRRNELLYNATREVFPDSDVRVMFCENLLHSRPHPPARLLPSPHSRMPCPPASGL